MVTLRIGGYDVKKVLMDQGSGAEIYTLTYTRAELEARGFDSL